MEIDSFVCSSMWCDYAFKMSDEGLPDYYNEQLIFYHGQRWIVSILLIPWTRANDECAFWSLSINAFLPGETSSDNNGLIILFTTQQYHHSDLFMGVSNQTVLFISWQSWFVQEVVSKTSFFFYMYLPVEYCSSCILHIICSWSISALFMDPISFPCLSYFWTYVFVQFYVLMAHFMVSCAYILWFLLIQNYKLHVCCPI